MDLAQAKRALSDGYRVALDGKELTKAEGDSFMLGGQPFTPTTAQATSNEWELIDSVDTKRSPDLSSGGKEVPANAKKAVAPRKTAAKKAVSH